MTARHLHDRNFHHGAVTSWGRQVTAGRSITYSMRRDVNGRAWAEAQRFQWTIPRDLLAKHLRAMRARLRAAIMKG